MPDTTIAVALTDKYSTKVKAMADVSKKFDKELDVLGHTIETLEGQQDGYNQAISKLKPTLIESKKELTEAQKAFKTLGDEASRTELEKASQEYSRFTNELKNLENQSTTTGNSIRKVANEAENLARRDLGMSSGGGSGGNNSMMKGFMASGASSIAGEAMGQVIGVGMTSALGSAGGTFVSGVLGGAAQGAVMGSMFGAPGAAIGGAIGAGVGAVTAGSQVFAEKDEAFKAYYNDLNDESMAGIDERITSGSGVAGHREQVGMAFTKRFGDEDVSAAYLDEVKTFAQVTNYDYDSIVGYSQSLLNTYDKDAVFDVLTSLSDATAGLTLDDHGVSMFINGLSRMRTTDKATAEYLNYFSERGLDVYDALAQGEGVEKSKVAGMVTKGEISGGDASAYILDYIDREFGGLSKNLMGTFDAVSNNLADTMTNIDAAFGDGYNTIRTEGMQEQTTVYGGALGDAESALGEILGGNKGYMENLQEQYKWEARSALLLGEESDLFKGKMGADGHSIEDYHSQYVAAMEEYEATGSQDAALDLQNLSRLADTLATNAFESSEQYKLTADAELDSIEATKELTAAFDSWTIAYEKSQIQSEGHRSTKRYSNSTTEYGSDIVDDLTENTTAMSNNYAVGLNHVPYDNFPAMLHEGERVLTAQQVRQADSAGGAAPSIVISGNTFHVRSEADIELIAQRLRELIELEKISGQF